MNDKACGPDESTLCALPSAVPPAPADPKRGARLREANRAQLAWGRIDLEAQLPEDHPARAIAAVLERLDLSALYAPIEARDEVAGAPAIDPTLLLGLRVYATREGEGSAREIWRLTQLHPALVDPRCVRATRAQSLTQQPIAAHPLSGRRADSSRSRSTPSRVNRV